jgi:hypothetical protein
VRFTLSISSSHSFGSTPSNIPLLVSPFRTRFRFGSACHWLNLAKEGNSPARSTKSTPSHVDWRQAPIHSALTACRQKVSGSISFPSRGAFHLSLTVLVHYRSPGYLALESGLPSFPTGSSCPVVLRNSTTVSFVSITGLSPSSAGLSRRVHLQIKFGNCVRHLPCLCGSYNSLCTTAAACHVHRVWALPGSFATTTGIVSFLQGT